MMQPRFVESIFVIELEQDKKFPCVDITVLKTFSKVLPRHLTVVSKGDLALI